MPKNTKTFKFNWNIIFKLSNHLSFDFILYTTLQYLFEKIFTKFHGDNFCWVLLPKSTSKRGGWSQKLLKLPFGGALRLKKLTNGRNIGISYENQHNAILVKKFWYIGLFLPRLWDQNNSRRLSRNSTKFLKNTLRVSCTVLNSF